MITQYPPLGSSDANALKVAFADGVQLDSFGRLRVSEAITLFDSQQEYGLDTLRVWDATANGTLSSATPSTNGSVTNGSNAVGPTNANTRLTPITVSGTSGHYAVLQSRQYVRYIPGKSHLILVTGIFSPGTVANTDARVGYFDSANGIFLKVTTGVASVVRRTSTSGSAVDNAVLQSAWNIDKMDGTGVSGRTIDLTKTQILFIQAQWLGVGRVVVGFDIDGVLMPVHQFLNANSLTVPYTQAFNLPVRLELRNTGASTGGSIQFVCCSVQSEGGQDARGFPHTVNNAITEVSCNTTGRPILSIRPSATYNSLPNRVHLEEIEKLINIESGKALWQLIIGGTLTGASWSAVTESAAEFDVSATAISGGVPILSGYLSGGGATASGSAFGPADIRNPLTLSKIDALAATQPSLTLTVRATTGTVLALGSFNWHEQVI